MSTAEVEALKKKLADERKKNKNLRVSLKKAVDDKFIYAQENLPGMGEDTKGITRMQYRYAMLRAQYPRNSAHTDSWCAIEAGYAEKDAKQAANKLNNHPVVRKIIDRANAKQVDELGLDAAKVLGDIMTVADRAMGREAYPVTVLLKDSETPVEILKQDYNETAALKANEMLGKHLKLFTDKIDHGGADGGPLMTREVRYIGVGAMDDFEEDNAENADSSED